MKKIILTIIFCLIALPCLAATYYIDYIGGSDSANGTTTGTPWKHAPGDCSSGNCNITPAAGDKIIFKGGVTYVGGIAIKGSGNADTVAGRVTYDGDSGTYVSRWGSGTNKAKIDGNATLIVYNVGNYSYITINNFELTNGKATGSDYTTALILGDTGSTYVTISNNTIHDVGHKTSAADYGGCGIASTGVTHWKILTNTIYNCYDSGIFLEPQGATGGNNVEIAYNNITDIVGWGIGIPIATTGTSSNWLIHDNIVHDIKWYSQNAWDDPHANFIWVYTGADDLVSNIYIYNNQVYNDGTSYASSGGIHMELTGTHGFSNIQIYNNTLKNIDYAGAIYIKAQGAGSIANLQIYNNSIYQPATGCNSFAGSCGGIYLQSADASHLFSNLKIENNIFNIRGSNATAIGDFVAAGMTGSLAMDYNLYYTANSTPFNCAASNVSFANWKTCTGQAETHSIGTTTDPLLIDVTANAHDLSLQAGSPAINVGLDLSSLFTTDLLGNARPTGANTWDIGAYEYGAGGGDVTAPAVTISTSSPQAISTNSLTVTGTASDDTAVIGCKWKVGSEPTSGGSGCTGTTSWSCSTSGYSSGANTLYVECYDAIPNMSTGHGITVNYTPPETSSIIYGGTLSGGKLYH